MEPPFRPFYGQFLADKPILEDGRQHTLVSGLIARWFGPGTEPIPESEPEEEPSPSELLRAEPVELAVFFPATAHFKSEAMQAFLSSLPQLAEPVSFEVFGNCNRVTLLVTASARDLGRVKPLLAAHFPAATFQTLPNQLATVWTGSGEKAVLEFGLGREFMLPLSTKVSGLLPSLCGVLQGLSADEIGLYQILFQPVRHR